MITLYEGDAWVEKMLAIALAREASPDPGVTIGSLWVANGSSRRGKVVAVGQDAVYLAFSDGGSLATSSRYRLEAFHRLYRPV